MTRRNGWFLIVFGLLLALGAGALVFVVLQQQETSAVEQARSIALAQATPVPTVKVPVAAHSLTPGAVLASDSYVLKDFPPELVPATAITDTAGLDKKVLVQPVSQGEIFHPSQFLGGSGAAISQQLPPGHVLFAFPVVDLLGQSNLIQDGDHVDLLLTAQIKGPNGQDTHKSTAITLQNIEVFKVLRPQASDEDKQPKATALLFSMTPEDSVMVKYVKDSGGVIDFTLRSPLDKEARKTPAVDDEQMIARYGFR